MVTGDAGTPVRQRFVYQILKGVTPVAHSRRCGDMPSVEQDPARSPFLDESISELGQLGVDVPFRALLLEIIVGVEEFE